MNAYKIIILGASGSGKTFFLASMYNKLSMWTPDVGFFLDVSPDQRIVLTNKYKEIEDPALGWPPGTVAVSEWLFTCVVQSKSGVQYPVFQFQYWDYAGERLTSNAGSAVGAPSDNAEIEQKARDANAALVLLDGQKILRRMEGRESPGADSLEHDLDHLLPIAQKLSAMPIHFVISKWDLLEGRYSLDAIRAKLLEYWKFQAIVHQRPDPEIPVRLIPVSSLGKGFAGLDEKGRMMKLGGSMRPDQVEMPMACVLEDGFKTAQLHLKEMEQSFWFRLQLAIVHLLQFLKLIGRTDIAYFPLLLPPPFRLGRVAVQLLAGLIEKGLNKSIEAMERERMASLESIHSHQDAVQAAIQCFHYLMGKLDARFPHSNLTRDESTSPRPS